MTDWYDREIPPGSKWQSQIAHELETAHVILLLISPSFIASQYCYDVELKRAMERHESGDACVIPVLLRPVDWEDAPFAALQALPRSAKPATSWDNQDEAFRDIAKGLRQILLDLRARVEASSRVERASSNSDAPTESGLLRLSPRLDVRRVSMAGAQRPLVSWLMVTTLTKHRWWKRLSEFLSEKFPPDQVEFIILGAQDADFASQAYEQGKKIASASAFLEGAEQRWENVVFVGAYEPAFNLYRAQNILTSLARGDVLIYRDADCQLVQYRFTEYIVRNLLRSRLGLVGVPSINDGAPFKPKPTDITRQHPSFPGMLLDTTVSGMAVGVLANVERAIGGRNEHTPLLQYTNYCAKMARMGLAMAYASERGSWLATATDESSITRTDIVRDPTLVPKKQIAFALLNRFYKVTPDDVFYRIQNERYGISTSEMSSDILAEIESRYDAYAEAQQLDLDLERFPFKPWECLSHTATEDYLAQAREVAAPYAEAATEQARSLGIL
jgi:hypothetical protein